MNIFCRLSLLAIPLIVVGCGRFKSNAGSNRTSINIYEIAPAGTDKPTTTMELDGKKIEVLATPVMTRNDIYHVSVETDERLQSGHYTLILHLTENNGTKFRSLAMRNLKRQIPVTVDGKMFSAPTIAAVPCGNDIRVSGPLSKELADRIAKEK